MGQKKVAVVTGAGSGIGRAIARRLAVDGYAVVASDVDAGSATRVAEEIDGVSVTADVTDPEAVSRLGEFVSERFERLDLWVANAGVSRMSPFVDIPLESFDRTMAVNLRGVFLCGQVAARRMIDKGGGAIVNVASMAGKQGRTAFLADYVASKFAVIGLTQAMAYELGPYGVRVNSVCPGFVDTPMQDRHLSWGSALRGVGAEELRARMVADTPLGRLEEPDDVAEVVAFLASDSARFITGEALAVNGGAFMD